MASPSGSSAMTPVCQHAAYFATNPGDPISPITEQSIKDRRRALGDKSCVACPVAARAIVNLTKDSGLTCNAENLAQVVNPARSGIWNDKGEFDEGIFDNLCKRKVALSDDKEGITQKIFNEFINDQRTERKETDVDQRAVKAFCIPITWNLVTSGSSDDIFNFLSDAKDPNGKPAVTMERLRTFYTNPSQLLSQIADD